MNISEFTELLEVIIWPITLVVLMIVLRPYLSEAFKRLVSLQAGPTGIAFTFEKALEEATESFAINKPTSLGTAKSGGDIAFAKAYNTPYEQLVDIKKSLDATINDLATSSGIKASGKSTIQIIDELSAAHVMRKETVHPMRSLVAAVNSAPIGISQNQVNQLQNLLDAL